MTTAPQILPPNQFRRFYARGVRIDSLRGVPAGEEGRPEDWIGSTTTAFGEQTEGLSRVADGRLVRDLIRADPWAMLDPAHVRHFGADPGILVKLLDAGERLPVHLHPGRAFAHALLGSAWGKTKAWLILRADPARPSTSACASRSKPPRCAAGSRTKTLTRCSRHCTSFRCRLATRCCPAGTLHGSASS